MCVLDRTMQFSLFELLLHFVFLFLSARFLLLHFFQQFKKYLEQLSLILLRQRTKITGGNFVGFVSHQEMIYKFYQACLFFHQITSSTHFYSRPLHSETNCHFPTFNQLLCSHRECSTKAGATSLWAVTCKSSIHL